MFATSVSARPPTFAVAVICTSPVSLPAVNRPLGSTFPPEYVTLTVVSAPAQVRALAVNWTLSPRSTVAVSGRMSMDEMHGPAGSGVGAGGGGAGRFTVTFALAVERPPRPLYEAVTVALPMVRAV